MKKECAEKNAKFLAEIPENYLIEFLQMNPIQKLETAKHKHLSKSNMI